MLGALGWGSRLQLQWFTLALKFRIEVTLLLHHGQKYNKGSWCEVTSLASPCNPLA